MFVGVVRSSLHSSPRKSLTVDFPTLESAQNEVRDALKSFQGDFAYWMYSSSSPGIQAVEYDCWDRVSSQKDSERLKRDPEHFCSHNSALDKNLTLSVPESTTDRELLISDLLRKNKKPIQNFASEC